MDVKIEEASLKHVQSIKKLLHDTWIDTYSDILSRSAIETITSSWHSYTDLQKQVKDPNVIFLIAKKSDDSILGMLSGRLTENNTFHLDRLYVHPEFQRLGIGTKLLNHTISSIAEIDEIQLQVGERNKKGANFWKKRGFKITDKNQIELDQTRLDILQMKKEL